MYEVDTLNQGKDHVLLANVFLEQFDLVLVDAQGLRQLPTGITEGFNDRGDQVGGELLDPASGGKQFKQQFRLHLG